MKPQVEVLQLIVICGAGCKEADERNCGRRGWEPDHLAWHYAEYA